MQSMSILRFVGESTTVPHVGIGRVVGAPPSAATDDSKYIPYASRILRSAKGRTETLGVRKMVDA